MRSFVVRWRNLRSTLMLSEDCLAAKQWEVSDVRQAVGEIARSVPGTPVKNRRILEDEQRKKCQSSTWSLPFPAT